MKKCSPNLCDLCFKKVSFAKSCEDTDVMTKKAIITRKIVVTSITGENHPNIYQFSFTSSANFMYCYRGHEVPDSNYTAKISIFPTTQNMMAISYKQQPSVLFQKILKVALSNH